MTETQTHKDGNHELSPTINARNLSREVANRILIHLLLIETINSQHAKPETSSTNAISLAKR